MKIQTLAIGSALLASILLLPVATAQTRTPTAVTTSIIEGKGDVNGVDDLYRFEAGPGDFTIAVEATTDYYSRQLELKLISANGREAGGVDVVASNATGRTSRTFHTKSHQPFTLSVHADRDASIKSLTYKVTLGGAVDAARPAEAPGASTTDQQLTDVPTNTPPAMAGRDAIAVSFTQTVNGLPALPASGVLRLEMKDGTITVIDLSRVSRLTYAQN
jgi:hypothetical protein